MAFNFNNPAEVEEFKTLASSKGMSLDGIDSFIESKRQTKPEMPNLSLDATGYIQTDTPTQSPVSTLGVPSVEPVTANQDLAVPQLGVKPVEPQSTGFEIGDMIPARQAQGLQNIGSDLQRVPEQKNDLGQPPSMPSLAGQDSPTAEQQQIPAPKGTPTKINFEEKIPEGYQFRARGRNDLTGQCAWFNQQITKLQDGSKWTIGSAIQDKRNQLAGHVKRGDAFYSGQDTPKSGNTIIFDIGTRYGHTATINEVMPDGKLKLTESNWNNDLKVSHTRIVDQKDPSIMGYMKTVPNTKGRR